MQTWHIGIDEDRCAFRACGMGEIGGKAVSIRRRQNDVFSMGDTSLSWWSRRHGVVIITHVVWISFIENLSGYLPRLRGGRKKGCPQTAIRTPCGEPFFCTERLNCGRKALCNASLATRLLSARLLKVCAYSTLA